MLEEDSDEELFVLKHIKPVNRNISITKAIEIKEKVLERLKQEPTEDIVVFSEETTVNSSAISNETSDIAIQETSTATVSAIAIAATSSTSVPTTSAVAEPNPPENNDKSPEKTKKPHDSPVNSQRKRRRSNSSTPSKKLTEYFTPTKRPSIEHKATEVTPPSDVTPKIFNGGNPTVQLSPALRKRQNRFHLNLDELPSTSKAVEINGNSKQRSPRSKRTSEKSPDNVVPSHKDSSGLYCNMFQKIIHDEMGKQLKLESDAEINGEKFERLMSEEDCRTIENFFKLDLTCQQFFVRMYQRTHKWNRLSEIKYDDINLCLTLDYDLLKTANFFDTNIEQMDLKTQLDLFKMPELTILCRNFNIIIPHSSKKEKIIDLVISDNKKQISALDMMKRSKKNSRMELLKKEIGKTLGPCFRLNEKVVTVFNRVVLLFSLVHNVEDENHRVRDTLYMLYRKYVGELSYFKYELSPCVIFKTRDDFLMYEKAVRMRQEMEDAVLLKDFEKFKELAKKARLEIDKILEDEEFIARYSQLPSFLKRFSAGSVYATILTSYCENLKKKTDKDDVAVTVSFLLEQKTFNVSKTGKWYELLCMTYESKHRPDLAAQTLLLADDEIMVNEVQKLTLRIRGQALLKKKTNGLKDAELRVKLDDISTISDVQEPAHIEINGKAMEGIAGKKSVYVTEHANGKSYSSVEEQAIYHYIKNQGFSDGMHVEGAIIQTIFYLLFFDIIYEISPPGVFQSAYQEAPLDLYSRSFYENRKALIDLRLSDMISWTHEQLTERINFVYYENFNVVCPVNWDENKTPELYCDIIKCIGMERLVKILRRLVENFRVFRSGFPDLTLWNPRTKKIKFVEVKSPNDRLSSGQRVWLNFLRNVGLECEVCNVKNVGGRRLRN